MVLDTDLEIFTLFVHKQYNHPCLNLNNSKNLQAHPAFFEILCNTSLYIRPLHDIPTPCTVSE